MDWVKARRVCDWLKRRVWIGFKARYGLVKRRGGEGFIFFDLLGGGGGDWVF